MLLSYFSFFTSFYCLALGIIGILFNPKAKLNRAHFLLSLSFSIWAFGFLFELIATSKESIWFWYRISSIGWLTTFYTVINFALVFSNIKGIYQKLFSVYRFFIALCILFMIYIQFTKTLFVTDFYMTPYGNAEMVTSNSFGFYFMVIISITTLVLFCFIVIIGRKYNLGNRYKIESTSYFIIAVLTLLFMLILNVVLPVFIKTGFPSVGILFYNFLNSATLFFVYKHKLMRIDNGLFKDEVVNALSDLIITIAPDKKILNLNNTAKNFIDKNKMDISDLFSDTIPFNSYLEEAVSGKRKIRKKHVILNGDRSNNISMYFSIFPVFDDFKDHIGTILIAKPLTNFEKISDKYKISMQERKIIIFLVEGLLNKEISTKMSISESTVKNHITNIYHKTATTNKVELVRLFFLHEI